MASASPRRHGFTLIELMICVAIIGLIATVAIPGFVQMQFRSKASEVKGNLSAIRLAQEAYFGEFGLYVSAQPPVPAAVGSAKVPWPLAPTDPHGFNTLGFRPEGAGYFQYAASASGASYTAAARSDLDSDTVFNTWGYVHAAPPPGVAGPFGTCPATGVFHPSTSSPNQLDLVGPCDPASGRSAF